MRSRVAAVGVGFLLNSTSRVTSWSWVARWRLLFFCCWVKVLLRGGRREADDDCAVALEVDGDGVEVGGEEDAVAVPAPSEGSGVSVNKDMVTGNRPRIYRVEKKASSMKGQITATIRFEWGFALSVSKEDSGRDDPVDKWRGVTVRVFLILFSRSSVKRERKKSPKK